MTLETEAEPWRRTSKVEPGSQRTEAKPVEPRIKAEQDGAKAAGKTTFNQGGAGGIKEPDGAAGTMVSGEAEVRRSQGGADRSTVRGTMGSESGGEARGSS